MFLRSNRLFSLCALSVCLVSFAHLPAFSEVAEVAAVQGEVLVGYQSEQGPQAHAPAISQLGEIAGHDVRLNASRVRLATGISVSEAIAQLSRQPGIAYVEPNYLVQACATPNDPSYRTLQYAPKLVRADLSWDVWRPRVKVVVAVVDTGVQSSHPDLSPVMFRSSAGAVIGWNTLNSTANSDDDSGHGTHSAGIVAGHINDAKGIAGIAGWNPSVQGSDTFIKVMPIKALNAYGTGTVASISSAIVWAADRGARVISVGAATSGDSSTMANAVQYAWNKGCVIVAAAGNNASSAFMYPAAYPQVLSVAATDNGDKLLFFSQYGDWVKCAAPGSNIFSTYRASTYTGQSGTSSAAPHVAAEAAAILAQNPALTNSQVIGLICSQVDPVLPNQEKALSESAGRINVYRALLAAGDGTATLTSISFSPAVIPNQSTSVGTVQIGGPAPAGGLAVKLVSSNVAVATVPASVIIPQGATSVKFTATGKLVNVDSSTTVTATAAGKSMAAKLTVRGSVVAGLSINPSFASWSNTFTCTVTLDAPAKVGGATVAISHNAGLVLALPTSVTVAGGATSASFSGKAGLVANRVSATVTASLNGGSTQATIVVNPPGLSSLTATPSTVVGGTKSIGKVTLQVAAPSGGATVYLASNKGVVLVPSSVTVPAGATQAQFTITTKAVSSTVTASVVASYKGTSKTALVTVTR